MCQQVLPVVRFVGVLREIAEIIGVANYYKSFDERIWRVIPLFLGENI